MNSDYCSACGGKVEYLLNKPNFCPSCGSPMGKSPAISKTRATIQSPKPTAQASANEDPEGTDVDYVPSIQGLQYELEGDWTGLGRNHGTLGSMLKASEPSDEIPQSAPKRRATAKKAKSKKKANAPQKPAVMPDAIKQSMKECGSSADNPSDVG